MDRDTAYSVFVQKSGWDKTVIDSIEDLDLSIVSAYDEVDSFLIPGQRCDLLMVIVFVVV